MSMIASKDQLRGTFIRWSLLFVPLFVLLGMLSAQASGSGPGNPWFDALEKPAIYPPASSFSAIWTILYGLMGFSLAMVASARGARSRSIAAIVFFVQFVLFLAWSPVFFGAHQITWALILIAVLDVMVAVTIVLFWKIRQLAALLLLPYFAWIAFATLVTVDLREANPGMDGKDYTGAAARIEF